MIDSETLEETTIIKTPFIIFKEPFYEDDDALFRLEDFYITDKHLEKLESENAYLKLKQDKFRNKDISPDGFEKFKHKTSLNGLKFKDSNVGYKETLHGSIYTHSIQERNQNFPYEQIMPRIKETLTKNPRSRRIFLRFANDIMVFCNSETYRGGIDVSCLAAIHYFSHHARIVFRAHDLMEEAISDLVNIYTFFLKPVYGIMPIDITYYLSTAQNIDYFKFFIETATKEIRG